MKRYLEISLILKIIFSKRFIHSKKNKTKQNKAKTIKLDT